jgi:hypothetical protein
MRKLRDVFYVKAYPEDNVIEYYGMEMEEFMRCSPIKPDKLLFLEAGYSWADFHQHTGMEILEGDKINGLLQDDILAIGDFCWVDYEKTEHLNARPPGKCRSCCTIGHMFILWTVLFLRGFKTGMPISPMMMDVLQVYLKQSMT